VWQIIKGVFSEEEKLKYITYILLVTLFVSCKTHLLTPDNDEKQLMGKWRWIETSGGFGGQISNPETEKITMSIEFLPKGIIREYKNKEFISRINYVLENGKSIYFPEEVKLINYLDKDPSVQARVRDYFEIKGDTLILKNECYDCFTKIFIRER